jgi:hypothetical protein
MNKFSCLILPIIHAYNAGISWLRSEDETPFVCLTLVGRHNFDHMPDSGWRTWLWSYARLRSEDMTPIVYPDSRCTSRFQSTSQLWSYLLTPVAHHGSGRWACGMSYHLSCETLHMTELDDCSILQPRYLVWSRLGGTHDSFSDWNLSISWLRVQVSGHVLRDQWTLNPAWSERNLSIQKNSVPLQLGRIKVFECLIRRGNALCRTTMALRIDHTWENP